jgi:hypothetical protein
VKPDGLLLLHRSNRYLNLCPVAWGLLGFAAAAAETRADPERGICPQLWGNLTRNEEFMRSPAMINLKG